MRRILQVVRRDRTAARAALLGAVAAVFLLAVPLAGASATVSLVKPGLEDPKELTELNGSLFFAARDPANGAGRELWKTDGTEEGTVLVKDIRPGAFVSDPHNLARVGDTLFFAANDGVNGVELWKSDGTEAGTTLVKDVNPAASSNPESLTDVGGTLFFVADDGVHGRELWKSDGTEGGTVLVKDVNDGAGAGFPVVDAQLVDLNGILLFGGIDGVSDPFHGQELWRSDGTEAGTFMVKDLLPGAGSGFPGWMTTFGGMAYFSAHFISSTTGLVDVELWRSDGTAAGTTLVKDIHPTSSSSPAFLTPSGGNLFFVAQEPDHGRELWKSDGTEAGTMLVKDINVGTGGWIATAFVDAGGILYFQADDDAHGPELWRSDGTGDGTRLVADARPGSRGISPDNFAYADGALYFSGFDGSLGEELWTSRGNEASTQLVADIQPGSGSSSPEGLTPLGSRVLFSARDGTNGSVRSLWKVESNRPPEIEPIADETVDEHVLIDLTPVVTDPEGDPFTLTWDGLPAGATTAGGVLSWTPSEAQGPGEYTVTLTATQDDDASLFDSETFTISVLEVNEPPVLAPIANRTVLTGDTVVFQAAASDPDLPANTLTFALGAAPAGATIDPLTGNFAWVACSCATGQHIVDVSVSDGELTDTQTVTITVQNRPPAVDPIVDSTVDEHAPIEITPVVTDPEGDPFTLTWDGLPAGATTDGGVFSWMPSEAQGPGDYTVTVTATQDSEPGLSGSETFTIGILEVNEPPVLDPIGPRSGVEGDPVEFTATASDPDLPANTLTFSLTPVSGSLDGATIDAQTGVFSCSCAKGEHVVEITVSDGSLADSEEVTITVAEAVPSADLQVVLAPDAPGPQLVGDPVAYTASVHNAGPDAAPAELTVELEHRPQADWGTVPPAAAINGIFFIDLGEIAAGDTVDVPFEVIYHAFGRHGVTATVAGAYDELAATDEVALHRQVVDLALDTPGVETGGLTVGGAHTTDGEPLVVTGVRVPSALIAGDPGWDLLLPAALTPSTLLDPDTCLPTDGAWNAGGQFLPAVQAVASGAMSLPAAVAFPDVCFAPDAADWPVGTVVVPVPDEWQPAGRLLLRDARGPGVTDLLVTSRADTTFRFHSAWPSKAAGGIGFDVVGGTGDGTLAFCGRHFSAHAGAGDSAIFTCGSLTAEVLTGEVTVELGDGTLIAVPAGATVRVVEAAGGGWDVTLVAGGPVTITTGAGTIELGEGGTAHVGGEADEPPVADAGGPYVGAVGEDIALDGSGSSDPDGDALTYAWSADGGAFDDSASPTPTFSAAASGRYTVTLEVCDPSGACATSASSVAVFDPSAGFVTGDGWIESSPGSCGQAAPAGVCEGDPAGRATFAVNAKYKKKASTPTGKTRFALKSGNLRFSADTYDWLVVSGGVAQLKGTGSIDGASGYEFLLTAFDGGRSHPDGFRIKIWSDLGVVYDSKAGSDDALARSSTQPIGGGQILIHRK